MSKNVQRGPFSSIVRAIYLLIRGRIHFPKNRLGETVGEGEDFQIFRHMTLDPCQDQPEKPGAIFKVRFQFATMSPEMNKRTSLIPIPFIVAQPGFRSKMWALGRENGEFQGIYERDTVASAGSGRFSPFRNAGILRGQTLQDHSPGNQTVRFLDRFECRRVPDHQVSRFL